MKLSKKKQDFTQGPIFVPMLLFVLPIMATGILQVLYNMADNIIVGQFSGDPDALGAVGSTSSLTQLLVNMLMGLAGGSGVVISHAFGAKNDELLSTTVHTAITFSLIGGISLSIIGFIIAEPVLIMMDTNPDLLPGAVLYARIIFLGVPASAVYNYGSVILSSVGDSKTSLYILSATGILNVLLNLLFVIVFNMSVAGVALATVIAQYVSATILISLFIRRRDEKYTLSLKKLGINGKVFKKILRYGIPASIQGSLFSISNVIITTGINALPKTDIAAKTIAANIEGIIYTALNSYLHTSMTFVGQNYGAKKPERIKKCIKCSVSQVLIVGLGLAGIMTLFAEPLAMTYIDPLDPHKTEVLTQAVNLMQMMLVAYVLCGVMEALAGSVRGLGYSVTPMLTNLVLNCGGRTLWVLFFFPMPIFNNLLGIYAVYPISWTLTIIAYAIILLSSKRLKKSELATE